MPPGQGLGSKGESTQKRACSRTQCGSESPFPRFTRYDPPTRGRLESGSATARLALGLGAASTMTAARWLVF